MIGRTFAHHWIEAARRRFRREAEALSRLNHNHIATVHDFDSADGVDSLVSVERLDAYLRGWCESWHGV